MSLLDARVRCVTFAALDFEGTGSGAGQEDEAVQVGIAVLAGIDAPPGSFFRSYVRPAGCITAAASSVHRISRKEVEHAPTLTGLWPEIKSRLAGAVVVAHGAGTEKRFLRAFPMHGFGPWIDTLALARAFMPGLADHSLGAVVSACGLERELRVICAGFDWHDALFDAVACLLLLRHCIGRFMHADCVVGQLAAVDAGAYHQVRRIGRVARDAGLHLRRGERI